MSLAMVEFTKHPLEFSEMVEVVLVSDDDGHEYLIPKELEKEFERLSKVEQDWEDEEGRYYEELALFNSTFSQYKKEGHTPPLYAKVGYESEL